MKRRNPTFGYQCIAHQLSRILEIQEIKAVPDVPLSHPFVERLIGTIRREFLDHVPFWTSIDLERALRAADRSLARNSHPTGSCDPGGREAGIPHFRFVRSTDTRHIDELLDEALEETLPASDSIAVTPEPDS